MTELCGRASSRSPNTTEEALQAARQRVLREIARRGRKGELLRERDIARIVATELQCVVGADQFENELARFRHHVRARQGAQRDNRAAEVGTAAAQRPPSPLPAQISAADVSEAMPSTSDLDAIRSDIARDLAFVRKHPLREWLCTGTRTRSSRRDKPQERGPQSRPLPMPWEADERQILDRWSRRRQLFDAADELSAWSR